jgi:predicted nucleotidyltransferase
MNSQPTRFDDLNAVLTELLNGAHAVLEKQLYGAYLTGSFALGDADQYSDVDFLVVTDAPVSEAQHIELGTLHRPLYALENPWAQHLEGSYAPLALIRRLDTERAPFIYLDNGSTELIWSDHNNTAVVRWTLREHGVALYGPASTEFMDPVTPTQLRHEMRRVLVEWADDLQAEPQQLGNAWLQPHAVLSHCRILYTVEYGVVASKRVAGLWARDTLAAEWSSLIQRALDDRPDPWGRVHRAADSAAADATERFVAYVRLVAARYRETG